MCFRKSIVLGNSLGQDAFGKCEHLRHHITVLPEDSMLLTIANRARITSTVNPPLTRYR